MFYVWQLVRPTFLLNNFLLWSILELGISILANCLATLRPLVEHSSRRPDSETSNHHYFETPAPESPRKQPDMEVGSKNSSQLPLDGIRVQTSLSVEAVSLKSLLEQRNNPNQFGG